MNNDIFNLTDRIVIVTGGLGQLGRQFALALIARGAKVAVLDQRADKINVEKLLPPDTYPRPRLLCLAADVTDRAAIRSAASTIKEEWGVPHALVNAAALDSPPHSSAEENGPFEGYPEASWDRVMAVNVKGVFLCCQIFGQQMAEAGRGAIVNISSTYGLVSPDQRMYEYRATNGRPFFKPVAYSASKSAILNLTRYLATYWAPRNVRVNTLTPGGVFNHQDQEFLDSYLKRVPLGRMAGEDEYNGAIVFLVSDASSYMTGSNLVIDGGWTAW
jgi:NAD(P)-dependent dehydrogenase (short-subunit alcohol dehydrogenase family)